jgi:hypothetical protein
MLWLLATMLFPDVRCRNIGACFELTRLIAGEDFIPQILFVCLLVGLTRILNSQAALT